MIAIMIKVKVEVTCENLVVETIIVLLIIQFCKHECDKNWGNIMLAIKYLQDSGIELMVW